MRKGCEIRRSSEIGIVDKVNDFGAMVDAIAPELFCEGCEGCNVGVVG